MIFNGLQLYSIFQIATVYLEKKVIDGDKYLGEKFCIPSAFYSSIYSVFLIFFIGIIFCEFEMPREDISEKKFLTKNLKII